MTQQQTALRNDVVNRQVLRFDFANLLTLNPKKITILSVLGIFFMLALLQFTPLKSNPIFGTYEINSKQSFTIEPRGSQTRSVIDIRYSGKIHLHEIAANSAREQHVGTHVIPRLVRGIQQTQLDPANESRDDVVKHFGITSQNLANPEFCYFNPSNGITACHIPILQGPAVKHFTLLALSQITIHDFKIRTLAINHQYQFGNNTIYFLLALVLITLPIIGFFHKNSVISQWLLIMLASITLVSLQPIYSVLLFCFLILFYYFGIRLARFNKLNFKYFLWLALTVSSVLLAAKYGAALIQLFFNTQGPSLVLPLGISYFVIRLLDTLLRWYRGELQTICLREYLCFLLFPPTLFAGPIETLENFLGNRDPKLTINTISYGCSRILIGLFKKIVLVNYLLSPVLYAPKDGLFFVVGTNPHMATLNQLCVLLLSSLFYAYLDFSGYSDIAIGLSRLYGYKIMENFTWPIFARNLQEFWRRWHRSLSIWCFRNIYFPAALSTKSPYLPIVVTMLTVGLWHAIGLSWFSWGIYHATALMVLTRLEKYKKKFSGIVYYCLTPLSILVTIIYVAAGHAFVLFYDYATAIDVFGKFWKKLLWFLVGF